MAKFIKEIICKDSLICFNINQKNASPQGKKTCIFHIILPCVVERCFDGYPEIS